MSSKTNCDIIVIGGGSAALEAAIAARQAGAESVVMLEKAPKHESGGNAQFSHVGFRFVHSGAEELRDVLAAGAGGAVIAACRSRPIRGRISSTISIASRKGASIRCWPNAWSISPTPPCTG